MKWVRLSFGVFALNLVCACSPQDAAIHAEAREPQGFVSAIVTVDSGQLRGTHTRLDDTVLAFKGIPYAAPPTGELRWRPPQPAVPWSDVRDATRFPADCFQTPAVFSVPPSDRPESEDCLYLNVWTQAGALSEPRPVMVWIHGGGFIIGASSQPDMDGANLARRGVVVVSMNYRLGPFGFLAHPAMAAESPHGSAGNYGIFDQIAALQWVQDNIAAFGGDPGNVTIFGESAGAMSVCYLNTTPLAKGLFTRSIAQSGGCFAPHPTLTEADHVVWHDAPIRDQVRGSGFDIARTLAASLGVEGEGPEALQALRAIEPQVMVKTLAEKGTNIYWRSVFVDGYVFPDQMNTLYQGGAGAGGDVMLGFNSSEGANLWAHIPEFSSEDYRDYVAARRPGSAARFLAAYAADAQVSPRTAVQHLHADHMFGWDMRTWARLARARGAAAFVYLFDHAPALPGVGRTLGATHGSDVPFVFGNPGELWEPIDHEVSEQMQGYWVNFTSRGNPNGAGLAEWPAYQIEDETFLVIRAQPETVNQYRAAQMDAYDALFEPIFETLR